MNIKATGSRWLWNGQWKENQYLCFRQVFELSEINDVNIILSCDTNYELWINGSFVECGQYLSLPEYKYYDKICIDKYLHKGKNVICILVYYQGVGTFCYKTGTPGLIYSIKHKDKYINNLGALVSEASGYLSGKVENITAQVGPSFHFDATRDSNWKELSYIPDDNWKEPEVLEFGRELPSKLIKRPVKKLEMPCVVEGRLQSKGTFIYTDSSSVAKRISESYMKKVPVWERAYKNLHVVEDNSFIIIDLGAEVSGYFTLALTARSETHIDIGYGEHLDDLGLRMPGRRKFAFSYKCKVGENKFTNYFRRIAGRYIQLNFTNVGEGVKIELVGIKKAIYPVEIINNLDIGDKLHRKIYEVCIKT